MLWFITADCPELIDAIPLAIHDEDGDLEDVKKTTTMADDVLDDVRYGLKSMLSPGRKPQNVIDSERLSRVQEPQQKAMLARFMEAEKRTPRNKTSFKLRRLLMG